MGLNFAVVVKGAERYTFVWDDEHITEVLRTSGRFAANPDLSFTWNDAFSVTQRVRMLEQQARLEQR